MSENPYDKRYDPGTTEYEIYLRTQELLGLQKEPDRRTHSQELMFQVIHQVEELWMKLAIHELGNFSVGLDEDDYLRATLALDQAVRVLTLCEQQLRLFSHMLPSAYLKIREGLGKGSGMDSPGFKRISALGSELWERFEKAMERQSTDLLGLFEPPTSHAGLLAVAEAMVSWDGQMQRFKNEHLAVVKRIIGTGTASLRGNPVDMLERSAKLTFFPMLWAVRDRMYLDFKAGPLKP